MVFEKPGLTMDVVELVAYWLKIDFLVKLVKSRYFSIFCVKL